MRQPRVQPLEGVQVLWAGAGPRLLSGPGEARGLQCESVCPLVQVLFRIWWVSSLHTRLVFCGRQLPGSLEAREGILLTLQLVHRRSLIEFHCIYSGRFGILEASCEHILGSSLETLRKCPRWKDYPDSCQLGHLQVCYLGDRLGEWRPHVSMFPGSEQSTRSSMQTHRHTQHAYTWTPASMSKTCCCWLSSLLTWNKTDFAVIH